MRYKEASLGWGRRGKKQLEPSFGVIYIDYSYSTIVPHTHLVIRSPLSLCNIYIYAHYLTLTMKYCVKTYIHGKYKKKIIKIMKNKKMKLNFYFSLLDFEFGFYFSHVLLVVTSFREFFTLFSLSYFLLRLFHYEKKKNKIQFNVNYKLNHSVHNTFLFVRLRLNELLYTILFIDKKNDNKQIVLRIDLPRPISIFYTRILLKIFSKWN